MLPHLLICHSGLRSELGAHFDILLHRYLIDKFPILVAVNAIVLILAAVGIRTEDFIGHNAITVSMDSAI